MLKDGFVTKAGTSKILPRSVYLRVDTGKVVVCCDALEIVLSENVDYSSTSVKILL